MTVAPFANEPLLELRRAPVRDALGEALARLDATLPLAVQLRVGGDARGGAAIVSTDPGAPSRVVAEAPEAGAEDVDAAVAVALAAQPAWAARTAEDRRAVLARAAELLRARRLELAALAVRECAKPWPEADGDVCEAIDFLEYYGRRAVALEAGPSLLQPPGERNRMRYAARGVAAVLAPWNFPLAIFCGMTAAALAVGSTVVAKPAEQAPACAAAIAQALWDAGVPREALAFLPGAAAAGAALVRHRDVQTIAFTGSSAVGLEIVAAAGTLVPGQRHLKRVVAEMGGKNCIVVDADADLDEAVPAILTSAFGFAGQKCSAASRVLAHERVHDALLRRLAGALATLAVGQASELATDVPPVIEQSAQLRHREHVADARAAGTVLVGRDAPEGGWFCSPAIAHDLPAEHRLLREEVFAPVCSVERVASLAEACDAIDASPFALTGGLLSRNPASVEYVWRRSPVGNLYVNREITGAMVGRQPFGGNRLSGNGTKAGGPDYLLHFVEPRALTENTVRHGLVM